MRIRNLAASVAAMTFALSFGVANAATPLSVSCSGTAATSSITWAGSASGGIAPYSFLWGNGSTSTTQTVSEAPGTYAMTFQATDASSSIATSTCEATVAQPQQLHVAPTIASFIANPASITLGQSTTLSWSVNNASSTSIDNNVGSVASTSVTVSPATTTTYTLTAMNPSGTTTAQTTVVVNASSTLPSIQDQIAALLQQIAQLQQQLRNLIAGNFGTGTTTPPVIAPGQIGKGMCVALNRDLGEGDDGDDVMQLQQMLASDPNSGFTATPTGYFGPLTMRAMMHFQEDNGIASSSTGFVGPLTRGFFERHCGEGLGHRSDNNSRNASSTETQNPKGEHDGVMLNFNSSTTRPSIQFPNSEGEHGNGNGNGEGKGHGHDD